MSRVRFRIRVLVSRAVAPQTPSSRYILGDPFSSGASIAPVFLPNEVSDLLNGSHVPIRLTIACTIKMIAVEFIFATMELLRTSSRGRLVIMVFLLVVVGVPLLLVRLSFTRWRWFLF